MIQKKTIFTVAILLLTVAMALAQSATDAPTGAANGTLPPSLPNSSFAWFRGGNNNAGNGVNNNIFGTNFNDPIYTETFGVLRTKLNGTYIGGTQYPIDGYTFANGVNKSGNMLISTNNLSNIYSMGAFSMLHLNGGSTTNGTFFVQQGGWRPWMDVGVTFTSNQDLAYVGQRQIGTGTDKTEMVINWSDNAFGNAGPDVCTFRFTAGNGTANNDLTGDALGGREIMRLRGDGNVGIGPRFSSTGNEPMSLLHLNSNDNTDAWLQISNEGVQPATFTGNNGLRLGILGSNLNPIIQNGNGFLYNQENRHLIFSTNEPTPTSMNNTNERVRITSISAPTNLPTGGYGVYNPGGLSLTETRMTVSLFPGVPFTRPLSLLNLGVQAGLTMPAGQDGWRNWMDIGTFTSSGSNHIYMGLKHETVTSTLTNGYDAVVGWGDKEPTANNGVVSNNLRFVFTANPTWSGNTGPAISPNGVEAMRMSPAPIATNGVYVGIGGDPYIPNNYSTGVNPGNTLEINSPALNANTVGGSSGLRFTDLNSTTPTTPNVGNMGVLAVNANGDVIYVPGTTGTLFGGICGSSPTALSNNWEIPLGGFNYVFSGNGVGSAVDNVGIGTTCAPIAKLDVRQSSGTTSGTIGINVVNTDQSVSGTVYGVHSVLNPSPVSFMDIAYTAGYFNAHGSKLNIAVDGLANGLASNAAGNIAGQFIALNGGTNTGVFAQAPVGGGNFAGHFEGDIFFNGTLSGTNNVMTTSDAMFKTNVDTLSNVMQIVMHLSPKTFYYDTANASGMNFDSHRHYGFIAQDVQTVIPSIVGTSTKPAVYDSVGNITIPSVTYKTLSYIDLIAFLTKGMQEQQHKLDSMTTAIVAMQNQMNSCCANNSRIQNPNSSNTNSIANQTDVTLNNDESIVLNQNVPNPFAEQTAITYHLPDNVQKAQILFYDAEGKLIKAVDLTARGDGQLNIFADDLSTGIYSYALVADGNIVDAKKMEKVK